MSQTRTSILAGIAGLCLAIGFTGSDALAATVISGALHEYIADTDTDGDTTWEDSGTAVGNSNGRDWALTDIDRVAAGAGAPFSHTYSWGGSSPDEATTATFSNTGAVGGFAPLDSGKTTFELWVRVASLPTRNELLWETGGTTAAGGFSLVYDSGANTTSVRFVNLKTTAYVADAVLDNSLEGEFFQIVGVIDEDDGVNGSTRLYINGDLKTTTPGFDLAWDTGGAGAQLGTPIESVPSSFGSSLNNFTGDIAVFRHYDGLAMTDAQVEQNYLAVIPEPGSATLGLVGAGLLAMRRRYQPRSVR